MLFNSLIFLLFGAAFFAVWPLLRRANITRWSYLVAASFFFYGWWDWRFLFLIIGSGLIDYFAGLAMQRKPEKKRFYLIASIIGNIGSLTAFKYSGFLAENIEVLLSLLGATVELKSEVPDFLLIVPVGISFYTFQSMSYTIDIYHGRLTPTRNVLHFFAYLSLFPQLVAGPIVRAKDLLPQLATKPETTPQMRWEGLRLIVHGYFKKVVIADSLAPIVNAAFDSSTAETSTIYWWLIMTMFGFQIYCDFSGYSDIARGLARWMGYDFLVNFNHPYIAKSLREHWTRWHISLSSWFRDYVYFTLGGRGKGAFDEYRNIWITMLLSGLWHGAAWTYVCWSAVHAFFLTIERLTGWIRPVRAIPGGGMLVTLIVITQVWISYVFFRAQDIGQAVDILGYLFSFNLASFSVIDDALFFKACGLLALVIGRELYFGFRIDERRPFSPGVRQATDQVVMAVMIAACVFLRGPGSAFIYFQF